MQTFQKIDPLVMTSVICNESGSNFAIGCWAFLLKKWLLFVKNHSPVIIAINSSKSTVPDPSSSTSSMICSRLQSSSDVSISRKISFNTSTVIYPFPVTQNKNKIQISRQIFLKCVISFTTSTVIYPFPVTQKKIKFKFHAKHF